MRRINQRRRSVLILLWIVVFFLGVTVYGAARTGAAQQTDFSRKDLPPSLAHPFGTDWMGRDMFARTMSGLSLSIRLGLVSAVLSAAIALLLGALAAMGSGALDAAVTWLIDLLMGIPHILLLILLSFAVGKGMRGVLVGITLSHWMSLARVIRGEVSQLKQRGFILVAERLGVGRARIVWRHMLPHILPQAFVGLILLFPHAILHEASITFLGFGLPPEQPAIGIILSESVRYLVTGSWWLTVFPGAMLVITLVLFDIAGRRVHAWLDPATAQL